MKQLKQESGRSMVEMLGVLAVIGVLSVGGISGYTLAMNKHRANSVAADLMKRAVVISAQRQLGQTANVQGLGSQVGEYELGSIGEDNANQTFAMTVQAVPEEVCKKILALDWDNATISPDTAEGCNGGDMTFTYNNDLSPVTGSEDPTCTGTVCGANCCPAGATCGENNECCIGETCAGEGQELYCSETNASGECLSWDTCAEGKSSKDWIVNLDSRKGEEDMWAAGACAGEGYEVYCAYATAMGECYEWRTCAERKSTGDSIVGVKHEIGAVGACAGENERYYCSGKTSTGECFNWEICPADRFDETTQTCN